uniref:Uncharacterized protein n=1 Tax=Rhizophora mucronata TaxID=61149 RepID=A0A2P2R2K5_RHIMU
MHDNYTGRSNSLMVE